MTQSQCVFGFITFITVPMSACAVSFKKAIKNMLMHYTVALGNMFFHYNEHGNCSVFGVNPTRAVLLP